LRRRGKTVEAKFTNARKIYEEAPVIMTMNRLPFDKLDHAEQEAVKTRTMNCRMENPIHELTEEFPFSTRELAMYLLQRYELEFPEEQWNNEKSDNEDLFNNENHNLLWR
jgi:hypothetical protein